MHYWSGIDLVLEVILLFGFHWFVSWLVCNVMFCGGGGGALETEKNSTCFLQHQRFQWEKKLIRVLIRIISVLIRAKIRVLISSAPPGGQLCHGASASARRCSLYFLFFLSSLLAPWRLLSHRESVRIVDDQLIDQAIDPTPDDWWCPLRGHCWFQRMRFVRCWSVISFEQIGCWITECFMFFFWSIDRCLFLKCLHESLTVVSSSTDLWINWLLIDDLVDGGWHLSDELPVTSGQRSRF